MNRDQMAFEIFLRKFPTVTLTDAHKAYYESAVEQAYETADLFLRVRADLASKQTLAQQAGPESEL